MEIPHTVRKRNTVAMTNVTGFKRGSLGIIPQPDNPYIPQTKKQKAIIKVSIEFLV